MSCNEGKATESLENEQSCDVGEVTERLENEQSSCFNPSFASPTSQSFHLASRPWNIPQEVVILGLYSVDKKLLKSSSKLSVTSPTS